MPTSSVNRTIHAVRASHGACSALRAVAALAHASISCWSTEAAQEGAQGRGRLHGEPEDPSGAARAQGVGVVDAFPTAEGRHDEREDLVADVRPAGRSPKIEVRIDEFAQAQMVRQGGRQHQARVGHQAIVVERCAEPVEAVR